MNTTRSHRRRILTVHAALFTLGAWGCCSLAAHAIIGFLFPYPVGFLAYLSPFLFRSKPELIVAYTLACPVMFFYFLYIRRCFHKIEQGSESISVLDYVDRPYKWCLYVGCAAALNVAWIHVRSEPDFIRLPAYAGYLVFWFLCVLSASANDRSSILFLERRSTLLLAAAVAEVLVAFFPLIFCRPEIPNFDFRNMPETTIVRQPATGKKVALDNLRFVNKYDLLGVTQYDPRVDDGHNPPHDNLPSVVIHPNKTVINFVHRTSEVLDPRDLSFFHSGSDDRYASRSNMVYDANHHELVAIGPIPHSDFEHLLALVNPKDTKAVSRWYNESQLSTLSYYQPHYTPLEWRFFAENQTEFREQVRSYGYFHHQSFVLGPINEMMLGRPLKQINSQYGFLNLVIVKTLMNWFGGLSWNTYQPVMFGFFYVYFFIALIAAWVVLRDARLVAVFGLLAAGAILMESYKTLSLAPGFNPLRHLFDLAVLSILYCYFRRPLFRYGVLLTIGLLLSSLTTATTGLFLGVGVTLSLLAFRLAEGRPLAGVLYLELPLIAVSVAGFVTSPTHDYMAPYYLRGLIAYPMQPALAALALSALIAVGVVLCRWWNQITPGRRYLLLASTIYSMGLFFYVVWDSLPDHLLCYAVIYIYTLMVFAQIVMALLQDHGKLQLRKRLMATLLVLSLVFNLAGAATYAGSWYSIHEIFQTHRTYVWSNPRARIETTIPPKMFDEATAIIDRYSHTNGIYMISRYDSILPFLAKRYNAMPFPLVDWFLVTDDSISQCVDALKEARPRYLFVDTDIDRNFEFDMINPNVPYLTDRVTDIIATTRVAQRTYLRTIFNHVRQHYHLVDKTPLISVWRRNAVVTSGHAPSASPTRSDAS